MVEAVDPNNLRNGYTTYQDKFLSEIIEYINYVLEIETSSGADLLNDYASIEISCDSEEHLYPMPAVALHLNKSRYLDIINAFKEKGWECFIVYSDTYERDPDNWSMIIPSLVISENSSVIHELKGHYLVRNGSDINIIE